MDLERYMIPVEEGLISKIKENAAKKEKISDIKEELESMEPKKAAERIIDAIKKFSKSSEGQKIGYTFATDADSLQSLRILNYNYKTYPGKINPTISEITTISGVKCILVTQKDKKIGEQKFAQLVIPIIANGKPLQEVVSCHQGALIIANNS